MSVHIKSVDREIVGGQIERFKHLSQSQMLLISEDDDFLGWEESARLVRG